MKYFITADLHLSHGNIIKYVNRPFKDAEHMNNELTKRWNERVKAEDTVFHVGDFCFKNSPGGKVGEGEAIKAIKHIEKLNGNIVFIRGNHDNNNSTKTIIQSLVIKYAGNEYNLVHNPDYADFRYPVNFTGHIHQLWKIKRFKQNEQFTDCINIGCDVHNYYPQTFEEIIKAYHAWLKKGEFNV